MVPNCQPRPCALTGQFPFVGTTLTRAVTSTFERRKTRINPPLPPGLSHCFLANETRAAQWRAYLDRNKLPDAPHDSARAGKRIHAFFGPVWTAIVTGERFDDNWQPAGSWGAKS